MPRLNGTRTPRSIAASIDGSIRRPTLATRAAGWASARHGSARHASAAAQAALRLRNSSGGFIRAWRRRGRSLGEQCVADPEAGVDVADRLAVGVVEMAAHLGERVVAQRALEHRLHALGRADADRVGDAAVVDADLLDETNDALDLVRAHLALVRATERDRDRAAHLDAVLPGGVDDRAETLDALRDRAVDVLLAERLGRGSEDDDLVGPLGARRRQRGVEAFRVRDQHRIANAGLPGDALQHRRVVGH